MYYVKWYHYIQSIALNNSNDIQPILLYKQNDIREVQLINLSINLNKSYFIKFSNNKKPFKNDNCVKLNSKNISFIDHNKYIDFNFCYNLIIKSDIKKKLNKFYK